LKLKTHSKHDILHLKYNLRKYQDKLLRDNKYEIKYDKLLLNPFYN